MHDMQRLHNVSMAEQNDLRARRRRQTTADIHDAALRLARELGFDNVTIEQISVEAGVSSRTFFNYFPTKESAVALAPLEIPDALAAEFIARGRAPHAVVLTELISLITDTLVQQPSLWRDFRDIRFVAERHPSVLAAVLSTFEAFSAAVAEVAAQRLGLCTDDEVPQLIGGLALATVRTGMEKWSRNSPGHPDTPVPDVKRAATVLRRFFGSDDAAVSGRSGKGRTGRRPAAKVVAP
jgi:AcrR family transcriptional regulator